MANLGEKEDGQIGDTPTESKTEENKQEDEEKQKYNFQDYVTMFNDDPWNDPKHSEEEQTVFKEAHIQKCHNYFIALRTQTEDEQAELYTLQIKFDAIKAENDELAAELEGFRDQRMIRETMLIKYPSQNELLQELENLGPKELKNRLELGQDAIDQLNSENNKLQERITNWEGEFRELLKKNNKTAKSNNQLRADIDKYKNTISLRDAKIVALITEKDNMRNRNNNYSGQSNS